MPNRRPHDPAPSPNPARRDRRRVRVGVVCLAVSGGALAGCSQFASSRDVLGERGVVVRSVSASPGPQLADAGGGRTATP